MPNRSLRRNLSSSEVPGGGEQVRPRPRRRHPPVRAAGQHSEGHDVPDLGYPAWTAGGGRILRKSNYQNMTQDNIHMLCYVMLYYILKKNRTKTKYSI